MNAHTLEPTFMGLLVGAAVEAQWRSLASIAAIGMCACARTGAKLCTISIELVVAAAAETVGALSVHKLQES